MKVGNQSIDRPNSVRRMNENVCCSVSRLKGSHIIHTCFQYTQRGGAYGNYSATFRTGLIDCFSRSTRKFKAFGMHFVLSNISSFHGLKRARADIKSHIHYAASLPANFFKQLRRKMQSCRRCRHSLPRSRVYRLVSLPVMLRRRDMGSRYIRRQRHHPACCKQMLYFLSGTIKPYYSATVLTYRTDFNSTITYTQFYARFAGTAGFNQCFPFRLASSMGYQYLNFSAGILPAGIQPGRDHQAVI